MLHKNFCKLHINEDNIDEFETDWLSSITIIDRSVIDKIKTDLICSQKSRDTFAPNRKKGITTKSKTLTQPSSLDEDLTSFSETNSPILTVSCTVPSEQIPPPLQLI